MSLCLRPSRELLEDEAVRILHHELLVVHAILHVVEYILVVVWIVAHDTVARCHHSALRLFLCGQSLLQGCVLEMGTDCWLLLLLARSDTTRLFLWRIELTLDGLLNMVGLMRFSVGVAWSVYVIHNGAIEINVVVHICNLCDGLHTILVHYLLAHTWV